MKSHLSAAAGWFKLLGFLPQGGFIYVIWVRPSKSGKKSQTCPLYRTFLHRCFIEYWNPIQYNELRKAVFETINSRGENANDLIEEKVTSEGLSYEAASREVVAEAMTDVLPDSHFVENLAQKHKSIFTKMAEKLREFAENIRQYFTAIGTNRSREANALKEQLDDTVRYVDSIVKLFDSAAEQAVENFQKAYAVDEAAVTQVKEENNGRSTCKTAGNCGCENKNGHYRRRSLREGRTPGRFAFLRGFARVSLFAPLEC